MGHNLEEGIRFLSAPSYKVAARFSVFDGVASWNNLNYYEGEAFFKGCDYGEDIDSPIATMNVELALSSGGVKLSPLITSNLNVGRAVRLETALVEPGGSLDSPPYRRAFVGVIDVVTIDPASNTISLSCSDRAAYFRDAFMQQAEDQARVYGSRRGTLREHVMQKIMDDNGLGRYLLWTPVPSESHVTRYLQKRTNVWEALQDHALQLGWDLRFRYFHNAGPQGDFALTFRDPGRAKTEPDYQLGLSHYEKLNPLTISLTDVRNTVELTYYDAALKEKVTLSRQHPDSVQQFRHRYMALQEEATSLINTREEATRLIEAIIADLAYPKATLGFSRLYWPYVELGDLVRLEPDFVTFATATDLAVSGYRHRLYAGEERTEVKL